MSAEHGPKLCRKLVYRSAKSLAGSPLFKHQCIFKFSNVFNSLIQSQCGTKFGQFLPSLWLWLLCIFCVFFTMWSSQIYKPFPTFLSRFILCIIDAHHEILQMIFTCTEGPFIYFSSIYFNIVYSHTCQLFLIYFYPLAVHYLQSDNLFSPALC